MVKADMYLLPGLKRYCAAYIAELMDEDNVFTILRLTRLFDLPKLEDQCAEFIANNIEVVSRYYIDSTFSYDSQLELVVYSLCFAPLPAILFQINHRTQKITNVLTLHST